MVAAISALVCGVGTTVARGEAAVYLSGERYDVPLPFWRLQRESSDGRAEWLVLGDPLTADWLASRAAGSGWRFIEQLGSGFALERSDDVHLMMTRRQVRGPFTRLSLSIRDGGTSP